MSINYTDKQREIVEKVLVSADEGKALPFRDLWLSLSYYPVTKQAVRQSISRLAEEGFLVRIYGYNNSMTLLPTARAYEEFRSTPEII